jgi:hypothetical protein
VMRIDPVRGEDLPQGGEVEIVEGDGGGDAHGQWGDKIGRDAGCSIPRLALFP